MPPQPAQDISELELIIKNYTTYFIVFDIFFFIILIVAVLFLIHYIKSGKKLKESTEYLRYTIQGQEEERERIARELHDTVAQNLRYCKSLCEKNDSQVNLPKIAEMLSKALTEVRNMSYNLSPPDIAKGDFLFCVKNLCEEFSQTPGLSFRLSILENTDASFLTKDEILNLYRIIQEVLTNIVKHAKASEVVMMIRNENGNEEKGLFIFISDDGCGFNIDKIDDKKHFGLKGMKKRADLAGAQLTIDSTTGEGTQIKLFKGKKYEIFFCYRRSYCYKYRFTAVNCSKSRTYLYRFGKFKSRGTGKNKGAYRAS